jgi:cytochrome c-type biogenesis protein CcmH/NrfG
MLNQCLKINEEHEMALELLSTLHLRQGDYQKCEEICNILLKVNPKNDQAGSILAEILLKENQYSKAIEQFKKMLEN